MFPDECSLPLGAVPLLAVYVAPDAAGNPYFLTSMRRGAKGQAVCLEIRDYLDRVIWPSVQRNLDAGIDDFIELLCYPPEEKI